MGEMTFRGLMLYLICDTLGFSVWTGEINCSVKVARWCPVMITV